LLTANYLTKSTKFERNWILNSVCGNAFDYDDLSRLRFAMQSAIIIIIASVPVGYCCFILCSCCLWKRKKNMSKS